MDRIKVVIAMDSFKGSATSIEVENWVEKGILNVLPETQIHKIPIADGGEGTVEALTQALNGTLVKTRVQGPLGDDIQAEYGLIDDSMAIIEMAQASGITLIEQNEENALKATTYGVGQQIVHAIEAGAKTIYLGLGGSATSDAGTGMARALGIKFYDANGKEVCGGADVLNQIVKIDDQNIYPKVKEVDFRILSDVSNPLTGPNGAIAIYGPQKGITDSNIVKFDCWMKSFAQVLNRYTGKDIENTPGAGAAGGLGAGLITFCDATIYQGIDKILELVNADELIASCDLVITGEGKMDDQTANGKAPIGIATLAKKYNKPVIAIVGAHENQMPKIYEAGIDLVFSVINRPMTLDEAIQTVKENVIAAGETAIRAFTIN